MSFRRIENRTAMVVDAAVLDDRHGRQVLTVIAKMTWAVSASGVVSLPARPSPVRRAEVWTAEPMLSSLRFPSDLVPEKAGTDVLLLGTARPPAGGAVTAIDVSLRVGGARPAVQKTARVHGPRVWYGGLAGVTPGPAARLQATPLRWELAYGGVDRSERDHLLVEDENPIGCGVARARATLSGQPAPVIEDPERPVGSRHPVTIGFGPIPAQWAPRSHHAGSYDESWKRERAPLPPADRDVRFYSSAPAGQWCPEGLLGDEPIELHGVTAEGVWRFRLPGYSPLFSYAIGGVTSPCPSHLDTVLIDADRGLVEHTYRASIVAPRKLQAIERVVIESSARLPPELIGETSNEPLPDDEMEAT